MDMDEKIKFMQTIVARVNGRAKIVAGAGTNCIASTIDLVKKMEACGVDGVLVVGPYYNKPTQEGYYQHFAAVAKATKLPIIVYNVPAATLLRKLLHVWQQISATLWLLKRQQAMLHRLLSCIVY